PGARRDRVHPGAPAAPPHPALLGLAGRGGLGAGLVARAGRAPGGRGSRGLLAGAHPGGLIPRLLITVVPNVLTTRSPMSEVLLEIDGGVAVVTLNAPERRNALTPAMADELTATFEEVDARAEVGAVVVRGTGRSFCAGGDVQTLTDAGRDPAAPEAYDGMSRIYDSFYRLGQVKAPTIAAVRGSAVG